LEDKQDELNTILSKEKVSNSSLLDDVTADDFYHMLKSSLVFAFLHGNVTERKQWFMYKKKDKNKYFASFPDLDVNSRRSTLVHMYRSEISKFLEKYDNTLITVLKRSDIKIDPSKRKFCFPKGHLLVEPSEIQQVRVELGRIFEQMSNKVLAERKFDLPWFTNPGKWEDIKKNLPKKEEK